VLVSDRHLQVSAGIVSATLLLAACGGGSDATNASAVAPILPASQTSPPIIAPRPVEQSDIEIATTVYSGTQRTPAGFYAESTPTGYDFVATSHVKNTDVDLSLATGHPQFELCTNDWNEALNWSETSAQNTSQYSALVATNDEARYFEFGRMRSGTPELYVQSRIYKCAYLDRSAVNLRSPGGAAGQINLRPLSAEALQRLSEYLWQFTAYNNFGHVVLKSAAASTAASSPLLEHTLYIASLVRSGMSPHCDRIDVIAWRHTVEASTGALTLSIQQQFSFGAREDASVAQLCAS
jgi:hypothetical protein